MSETSAQRLSWPVKLAYGFGLSAEGIKNNTFIVFLLFYYQQVVGLDSALCGLALLVALMVDAVTDPPVGIWSDGLRSRLGRRHPFMYASIVPVVLCFIAVLLPPAGLGQGALFAWLLVFAVGTRVAMTLFYVPHMALMADLTQDYDERTRLQSLRICFSWTFGLLNAMMAYRVFLVATDEFAFGLLNPAGYRAMAFWGGAVMFVSLLTCSLATQRAALRCPPRETTTRRVPLRSLVSALREALRSPSYRHAILAGLFLYTSFGIYESLVNFMNTFFWEFTSEQIGLFVLEILALTVLVLIFAKPIVRRFGKRRTAVASAILYAATMPVLVSLRFLGLLPANGDPNLMLVAGVAVFFSYTAVIMGMVMVGAMIADVTDEHELRTGARQEGLLFSGNLLVIKAASGFGVLFAGLAIKLIGIPEGATPGSLAPIAIRNLGIVAALNLLLLGVATTYFFARYRLTRGKHAEILATLASRLRAERGEVEAEPEVEVNVTAAVGVEPASERVAVEQ